MHPIPLKARSTDMCLASVQLPSTGDRQGSVDDLLEQLMSSKLAAHVARAAIESRLLNRTIMIDNPVARLVSAGQPVNKHRHAARLLSRDRRSAIADVPAANLR